MPMTIPQALQWWFQRLGRRIHFAVTPPACEHLMAQARAARIPVGQLYVVSRPLAAGSFGTYDRDTGDLCCHYEASRGEEGQREMLQCLLILLASVKLQIPIPQTIAQEWESMRQAIEEAHVLAQQWGQTEVFSSEDRTRLLMQQDELASCYSLAGQLAGHTSLWVARTAYAALQARRSQFPTLNTQERFLEALRGTSSEPRVNDEMVTFDRFLLRERWVVTSTRPHDARPSFRDLTVLPLPRSAQLLRTALAHVASWMEDPVPACDSSCWYQEVTDELDLALLLRIVNTWLIDIHPQAAARLYCWVYGDAYPLVTGSPRVYRLSLGYEDAPLVGPTTRDLWVLFATRPAGEPRAIESAWQAFLSSWLTWSEVLCEPLAKGLQTLWARQGGQQ